MSLLDYKITDQSVQGVYVQSQPDRLTGTPQQNKAAFDAYPALIRKQFNLLVTRWELKQRPEKYRYNRSMECRRRTCSRRSQQFSRI